MIFPWPSWWEIKKNSVNTVLISPSVFPAAATTMANRDIAATITTTRTPMSTRAKVLARRTYSRLKEDGTYESWEETIDRAIRHQAWLWARARRHPNPEDVFGGLFDDVISDAGRVLPREACEELGELQGLMRHRAALLAGRTLWLGGTETARRRESSQFNCAFLEIETVFDLVDAFWLLLQGCGVGFKIPCNKSIM